MVHFITPSLWLLILILSLPQFSEAVYSTILPSLAVSLNIADSQAEYTLTIYLLGFAFGTIFWGKLSDKVGRKPCVIAGLIIFLLGCTGCYLSFSISLFLLNRFIQAFGGSIGSVLGQAICRDSFHGPALGKVFSTTSSIMAILSAIGTIAGGFIAEHGGWSNIFLLLLIFGVTLLALVISNLHETHLKSNRRSISLINIIKKFSKDKQVIAMSLIIAVCASTTFIFFAEGSFYLIEMLGLSPSQYGISFVAIAFSSMLSGVISHKLHNSYSSTRIMDFGFFILLSGSIFFSAAILIHVNLYLLPQYYLISITILAQMFITFGSRMISVTALATALKDYRQYIGTASSVFGFFNYILISLFTLGIGVLHTGGLLPLPLYFLTLSFFSAFIFKLVRVIN